jgi:hypothetical protein
LRELLRASTPPPDARIGKQAAAGEIRRNAL